MKNIIFILLATLLPLFTFGQFAEKIVSGRPGLSNGPFGVGKQIYQVQSGLTFSDTDSETTILRIFRTTTNNSSIFRIGIFEKTEFRLAYSALITDKIRFGGKNTFQAIPPGYNNSGIDNLALGFRQNLSNHNGIVPAVGVQFTANFGGFGDYNYENDNRYEGKLLLQHKISEVSILNTNLAVEYNHNLTSSIGLFVLSYSYTFNDKWRGVVETYGLITNGNVYPKFDLGMGYFISNNLQVDLFGGFNKTNIENVESKNSFISLGVSYRLGKRT